MVITQRPAVHITQLSAIELSELASGGVRGVELTQSVQDPGLSRLLVQAQESITIQCSCTQFALRPEEARSGVLEDLHVDPWFPTFRSPQTTETAIGTVMGPMRFWVVWSLPSLVVCLPSTLP